MSQQIDGFVEPGWERVRDVFQATLDSGEDLGASTAVFHRGRLVVDLAGGEVAPGGPPYDRDTLQLVFSTSKGITAIAVAMCVERGLLDPDGPVADVWPEFAARGKGAVTVAQLLSHQAGLITVDGLTLDEALDWDVVTSRLAVAAPDWPLGRGHGYHAITYGWLAGELVARASGRPFAEFLRAEIVEPLGVELWMGLPEELEPRVSPLIRGVDDTIDPAVKAMVEAAMGPATRGGRALSLSGAFNVAGAFNRSDVHAACLPAANCISKASALATVYAATLGEVNGVRLLQPATVDRARALITPVGEPDLCLIMPTTFGLGFMVHGPFTPYAGSGSYGHPGAGGSVAFAQPERDLAFAYAMNTMAANLAGDLRAQRLIEAATAVIDGQ